MAENSHESRAEKVADYTLSSCLTEDVSSIELPREVASALVKLGEMSEGKHRDVRRFGFRYVWEFWFRCKCKLIETAGVNGFSGEKAPYFL